MKSILGKKIGMTQVFTEEGIVSGYSNRSWSNKSCSEKNPRKRRLQCNPSRLW